MIKNAAQKLEQFDFRLVVGMMLLFIVLVAVESWMLVLKAPYMKYKQISVARKTISVELSQPLNTAPDPHQVENELEHLAVKLQGELNLPTSNDEMAASLMEVLDYSASSHNVTLASVKPKGRRQVSLFEEISFGVSAKGSYLHLTKWMLGFTKTLDSNVTITEFSMKPAEEGQRVELFLDIALYRPLGQNMEII